MKKMFIFVMALAMCVSAMATQTAIVQVKLTGVTGGLSNSVYLVEDDGYTSAYESGADVEKIMDQANSNSVLMYGFVGTTPCGYVVTDNLDGLNLGLKTNQVDANYTLTFKNVSGRELRLYDRVTKTPTVITNNGTYNFSVETSQVGQVAINDRFVINYEAPAYVIMNGDFADPGNAWAYTSNFTDNGTNFSLNLDLAADTWYHFQLEEGYSPALIAADGSEFNRTNNSHNLPVDGWHSALLLHADVAGTYTFTWNDLTDNLTITFPTPSYAAEVTTNADGLATFSHASALAPVEAGVKLYKGAVNGEYLDLTQVNDIAAAQGVIVYGEPNTTYHFNAGAGTSDFAGNELLAASAWEYPHAGFDTYVLSGNALYLYEGDDFPANKAFLKIAQSGSGAPRRISLRFDQATAIDNVAAENVKAEKVVENGQIFIRRGNEVYNLQGQLVK